MSDTKSSSSSTAEEAPPDSHISSADSLNYWNNISPDVSGMLGGYPQVSRIDLQGSKTFFAKLRRLNSTNTFSNMLTSFNSPSEPSAKLKLAVDCGAGIGRITNGFLSEVSEVVDIVEPVAKFAEVMSNSDLKKSGRVGDIYTVGLEAWEPEPDKQYDLVWNQWCVGHLTDEQLIAYLKRCAKALAPGGWIVVKENLSTDPFGEDLFDDLDSSVTRSDAKFRKIFEEAELVLAKTDLQAGFPKSLGLYPVRMYGLRPK